jgi:hypothetical protein
MTVDLTSLGSVLLWLAGGIGGPAVVMQILSLLGSKWAWWNNLPSFVQFVIPMVLSVLIALGASLLLTKPDIVAALNPVYVIIMQTVVAYLASQKQYQTTKTLEYKKIEAKAAVSSAVSDAKEARKE